MKDIKISISSSLIYRILIVVLILIGYLNTIKFPFVLEDLTLLKNAEELKDFFEILSSILISQRWFVHLTFSLNFIIGGFNSWTYHLVNLLIHTAATLILFSMIQLLARTPAMSRFNNYPWDITAFIGAMIFALHPIQTESVTYISQRTSCLTGLLYLSALYLFLQARCKWHEQRILNYRTLISAFMLSFLAFKSGENAASLPLCLLVGEFIFFPAKKIREYKTVVKAAALLIVIFTLLATPAFLPELSNETESGLKKGWDISAETKSLDYFFTELNVVRIYLGLVFYPVSRDLIHNLPARLRDPLKLSIVHDVPVRHSLIQWDTLLSLFLHISLIFCAVKIRKQRPLASAGVLLFYVAQSVESSIIPFTQVIAEHREYLPMAGFGLMCADLLSVIFKSRSRLTILAVIIAVLLTSLTIVQNRNWKDKGSLWAHIALGAPYEGRPLYEQGQYWLEIGDYSQASKNFAKLVRLDRKYPNAHKKLGLSLMLDGKMDLAKEALTWAVRLNPQDAEVYYHIGSYYIIEKDFPQAINYFRQAVQLNPEYFDAYDKLGVCYLKTHDYDSAAEALKQAYSFNPEKTSVMINLALAYNAKGDTELAEEFLTRVITKDPNRVEAYINLGFIYCQRGLREKALGIINHGLLNNPGDNGLMRTYDQLEAYCSDKQDN